MSNYCTLDEARSEGARGSDAEVTAAIVEASERVERYTGELFELTPLTIEVVVDSDGIGRVRKRIESISTVTWYGAPQPVAATAYRVSSSKTPGGRDQLAMYGDLAWADVTVLGAEPWNGGWANLAGREPRLSIVGVFGWNDAPPAVRRATAKIAAQIRLDDRLTDGGTVDHADDEGNVLPVVPPFASNDTTEHAVDSAVQQLGLARSRTTGVVEADVLLASYVREPVRFR